MKHFIILFTKKKFTKIYFDVLHMLKVQIMIQYSFHENDEYLQFL